MAGYVIHLAIGEEYIRRHPKQISNYNEIIAITIAEGGAMGDPNGI